MIHKMIVAFSLLMLLLTQRQAVPAKDYTVERFDASIMVNEGGSLIVTETVTFKFVGGPFTPHSAVSARGIIDFFVERSQESQDQTMHHFKTQDDGE